MKHLLLYAICCTIFLTACSSNESTEKTTTEPARPAQGITVTKHPAPSDTQQTDTTKH